MDATVQTLVTQLSNGQADLTEAQNLYNDIVGDFSTFPILTNTQTVNTTTGQFSLPNSARALFYVAAGGQTVGLLSRREANWLFPNWEETTGSPPQAYITESQPARLQQLIPIPTGTIAIQMIYAETRQTLPYYLQLPVALYILYHEYLRASDHQNFELSKSCKQLADFLMQIIMKQVKQ